MQRRSPALLWDVATAARRIQMFVADKSWDDYSNDLLLRSAVERQFEIAGEALNALRRIDPATAARVPGAHRIIGMRNILIHGYAQVNDLTVWRAATTKLNEVVEVADALIAETEHPRPGI